MKAIKEFIRLNKKMFYIFCGVIGIFVLLLIILLIVKLVKGTKIGYDKLQDKMISAAENYYGANTETLPINEGDEVSISVETLVEKGYLKSLDKLVDASCTGNVTVKKNGEQYMYYPSLDCGSEYKTRTLGSIITDQSNIVESGDGLYKYDDGYVFRGEYVNNYVSFADSIWRIINIDNGGNIRIIKNEILNSEYPWDDRYNVSTEDNSGINEYGKSRIYDQLEELYNSNELFGENDKKHLIAYDACIGKRSFNNTSIDKNLDCNNTIKVHVGLPIMYDVLKPSLDQNCNSINDKACSNYNYFTNFLYYTWFSNAVTENNYEVYSGSSRGIFLISAEEYLDINPVITLSSKEIYSSGNGSEENPYFIYIK